MHELLKSKGYKPRRGIVRTCVCGKEFYINPSRIRVYNTCSRICKFKRQDSRNEYICKVCGTHYWRFISQIKHRGESVACSRKCLDESHRGSGHPRWIKTRSEVKCRPNGNKDHKEWREKIFKRDDYTCQICHTRGKYLEAHHIKPWAYFAELRFDLSNGQTLCKECHNKTKLGRPIAMKKNYKNSLIPV